MKTNTAHQNRNQTYNFYIESAADHLLDEMIDRKVFIPNGSDARTEFEEGINRGRRNNLVTSDPAAMRLDEWAAEYGISTSELISMLNEAVVAWERIEVKDAEIEAEYKAYCELEEYKELVTVDVAPF